MSPGDGQADPSILAVFQDYVKLMPMVVEANQMSDELEKVTFPLRTVLKGPRGLGKDDDFP